jgi:hypothetical protein
VGEAKRRQRAVLCGERGEGVDEAGALDGDELEGVADLEELGVAVDKLRRRAKVEDRPRKRRNVAQRVEVGHDVVPKLRFVAACGLVVDVVEVGAKLVELLGGDVEAERRLRLRQRQPQPPPRRELSMGGPKGLHLLRRKPRREGRNEGQSLRGVGHEFPDLTDC